MSPAPPLRAERIARWSLAGSERQNVLGDMHEEFVHISEQSGAASARSWYWRQTLVSIVPNALRRASNDERRRSRLRFGVWYASLGMVGVAVLLRASARHGDITSAPISALMVLIGIWNIARAVFATRPRLYPIQSRVMAWPFGAALLAGAVVELVPRWHLHELAITPIILSTAMAIGLAIELWPRWPDPAPAEEFSVWINTALVDGIQRRMSMVVPNAPLGLSGLVLRAEDNPADRVRAPGILQRRFSNNNMLHLYAAVNGMAPAAHATIQVTDAAGRVVRAFPVSVDSDGVERVQVEHDDPDDAPTARSVAQFGRIDATLPLPQFQPGAYRVRLTVTDGASSSIKQDEFVITPPAGALT